ncbi:HEAT repeat domain-containing protein [Natrialba aegyptia]|uniref:HEAT repeat protein n=1 Tax=Natrialba aegyptia DSM 13077 TaxID=1227491 RepID=M0AMX6_9EURY|nr:HEAT repeat domain-containing protein [Natrialba aegyptia]ELY98738.1 hypothetical protein C480_20954 [Natrialba aegyptia DSM 13077]
MDDSTQPPIDRLEAFLEGGPRERAVACLEQLAHDDAETRKTTLQALRQFATQQPSALEPVLPTLAHFLTDEERSVRLTTAKLIVAAAETDPNAAATVVSPLADRLADEDEFYYVRGRSAEALGYIALERPAVVASPDVLADLRIGLSFDEPEVREKLAKALECVALGDQHRLRHHTADLSRHLSDRRELVRYRLCTALVAVGCEYPTALAECTTALADRVHDESPYVRGRVAEAFGLLARSEAAVSIPELKSLTDGDALQFLVDRVEFAVDGDEESMAADVGTIESIRERTDEIATEITAPDGGVCPHCGLALPESGPPLCPQCGAPR